MNLFDLYIRAGYETASLGEESVPCTLLKGGTPVGFLLPDFSLSLVAGRENEREELSSLTAFALENQGLETVGEEYKLSQYQDTVLTSAYDFDRHKPLYRVYSRDGETGNLTLRDQDENREEAARRFARESGLLGRDIALSTPEERRIERFLGAARQKGYTVREEKETAGRKYTLRDRRGQTAGYIGFDNKVVLATADEPVRQEIRALYRESNPMNLPQSGFFERLRVRLTAIGMALRTTFGREGRRYSIHEGHARLAEVKEDHSIVYTDAATHQQMERINAVIAEINREQKEQTQEPARTPHEVVSPPALSPEAKEKEVVLTAAETHALLTVFAAHPALFSALETGLREKLDVSGQEKEERQSATDRDKKELVADRQQNKAVSTDKKEPLKDRQQTRADSAGVQTRPEGKPFPTAAPSPELLAAFQKDFDLLQTLNGFNQADHDRLEAHMLKKYGTLDAGQLKAAPSTLDGKLEQAKQKAAALQQNRPTQPEPGKER